MAGSSSLVSIRFPDELRREVDELAKLTKQSRSFVVKEAVSAFLLDNRAHLEAIDEAVAEADKGVFVSGDAVDRWLASWGSGDDSAPPEPDIFFNSTR